MLYDKEVDKTIIKILHDTNRQSYNNLHKNTCNTYRKITRASFDFHVSKLKEEKIIEKKEVYEGKIKKSYYYLTADAKQKYRLQILSCKTEKEKTNFITMIENEKRLIYYLLLLYEYRFARTNPEQFRLNLPEKELDIHLSKCNTSRNDLFIDKSFAKNGFKYSKRQHVTAFKTEKDIHVYKFEKFNKTGELTSTFYNLNLPGF